MTIMISKKQIFVLTTLFLFLLISAGADSESGKGLKIYFFDVGQGDSVFIETELGKQILIDGGPDNSVIQRLSEAMPFWDRTIDLVVLTHTDHDHIGGLPEVLKRYQVKGIIETGTQCDKAECAVWRELEKKEEAEILTAKLGDSVVLDKDTKLLILNPFENIAGKKFSKANNSSIVAKLIYGGRSFLFTGDIEKQIEEKLVLAGLDIDSDFMKIPHHGSRTSSSDEFLDKVSPLAVFISLGRNNSYGHPHKEVVERLEKNNLKYYRTDELGTVLLSCRLDEECRVSKNNK